MPRSYCTTNDVKQYLPPNVVTEGDNPIPNFRNPTPESASNINLDFFILLHKYLLKVYYFHIMEIMFITTIIHLLCLHLKIH